MDKDSEISWKLAEKIIRTDYEIDNIKIMPLRISLKGIVLNIEGLYKFLDEHEKKEEIINTLSEIDKKYYLPDFICMDTSNNIFFVEVKNRKDKITLSKMKKEKEAEAIKELADKGYACLIKNVQIPSFDEMTHQEKRQILEEYGNVARGRIKGEPIYYLEILEENKQSEPYPNVSIWNLFIRTKKRQI